MGGDGHGFPYKVPDWKTYKVSANTPELQQVERMLKSLGLKVGVVGRIIFVSLNYIILGPLAA